jgi:hypothetical protein
VTIPPYSRLAAKLLKREHDALEQPAQVSEAARADAVSAIERALVQRARKQKLQRVALACAAGAAAAATLAWYADVSRPHSEPARVAAPTATTAPAQEIIVHPFGDGARVFGAAANGALQQAGARVHAAAHGRALLAFSTGTRVMLEEDGDLTLVENGAAQVLALDHGALRADVAKLAPGRRFLVHTADAEVEVHGTSFRVLTREDAAHCAGAALTQVEVFEGVVTVRSDGVEHRIEKGGEWSASCPEAQVTALPEATARRPDSDRSAARERNAHTAPELTAATTSSSDLIVQNDAFAAAVAAHRAGDLARAARGFDDLLARFPHGPLAESAAVQRLKVVRKLDPARARALSREYLARYPDGFARMLASEIAAESP